MSPSVITLIEWSATVLSLVGFWLCIRHQAVCFLFFLVADAGWFASALVGDHATLVAQQSVYILMNVVGYWLWRRDEREKKALETALLAAETRPLAAQGAATGTGPIVVVKTASDAAVST